MLNVRSDIIIASKNQWSRFVFSLKAFRQKIYMHFLCLPRFLIPHRSILRNNIKRRAQIMKTSVGSFHREAAQPSACTIHFTPLLTDRLTDGPESKYSFVFPLFSQMFPTKHSDIC
jgi:hypothetical protein